MKNTTIAINEQTLKKARKHAAKLGLSFNAWVNGLIENSISRPYEETLSEIYKIAENASGNSEGKTWSRDEIYERK